MWGAGEATDLDSVTAAAYPPTTIGMGASAGMGGGMGVTGVGSGGASASAGGPSEAGTANPGVPGEALGVGVNVEQYVACVEYLKASQDLQVGIDTADSSSLSSWELRGWCPGFSHRTWRWTSERRWARGFPSSSASSAGCTTTPARFISLHLSPGTHGLQAHHPQAIIVLHRSGCTSSRMQHPVM
jgi:hypothetical protein